MQKLKYLIKIISHMNFKGFFATIGEIHKKSRKSRIWLFFDIIYCGLKYQAGYIDYKAIHMYDLNAAQRDTHITRGRFNAFVKKYNDPKYAYLFFDKAKFNETFAKYMLRDWLLLDGHNQAEFQEFLKKNDEFIAKPVDGTNGKGVVKIKSDQANYQELMDNGQCLVEGAVKQCAEIAKLNPSSVNTLRIMTFYSDKGAKIVKTTIRIGNGGVVDNFGSGGMMTHINPDTHEIAFPAVDKKGEAYEIHPLTKIKFVGYKIPRLDEVWATCLEASAVVKEIRLVAWDVAITDKGICLIEGNDFPGHDLYQHPIHFPDGYGSYPDFLAILKD